jgi:hypothetical protein
MSDTNPASSSTSGSTTTSTPSYGTNEYVINGTLDLPQTAPSSEQFLAIQPDGTVVASGSSASSFQGAVSTGTFSPSVTFLTGNYTVSSGATTTTYQTAIASSTPGSTGTIVSGSNTYIFLTGNPNGPQGIYLQIGNYVQFSLQIPFVWNADLDNTGGLFLFGLQFDVPVFPSGSSVQSSLISFQVPGSSYNDGSNATSLSQIFYGGAGLLEARGTNTALSPQAVFLNSGSPTVTIPSIVMSFGAPVANENTAEIINIYGTYILSS